jgi:radical SAM protein
MLPIDIRAISPKITGISPKPAGHPHGAGMHDYSRNPMLVYWEMTQACGLACRHCRAEAMATAASDELNHTESMALLQQIAAFDTKPHVILTGGDPLRRADLYEIITEARRLGLTVSITPAATESLTPAILTKLKDYGIDSLGLSLDGSTAERHEAVRGVAGCYNWTIDAIRNAADLGFPIQVNTLVSQETADDLPAVYELLTQYKIMRWSLFYLIAVGRGKELQPPVSPEHGEELMHWTYELTKTAPFAIKTTEAPSYRRVALNHMRENGWTGAEIEKTPVYRGFGIRDGHGIMFVSNQGDIFPAGFLPLATGNVRVDNLVDIYRDSPLFKSLHDPSSFRGKCGECEYRTLCGGSRARAFAYTGDPLASDPFCAYEPRTGAHNHKEAEAAQSILAGAY